MKKTLITQITECIEHTFDIGGVNYSKRIIIFPCGDIGIQVINIMKTVYAIEPAFLIDNKKCKYSTNIHDMTFLENINCEDYVLFLTSTNVNFYLQLRDAALGFFQKEKILQLECMIEWMKKPEPKLELPKQKPKPKPKPKPKHEIQLDELLKQLFRTKVGKYSYGPICCNHELIRSIGAFCSFAIGVDVVPNHEMHYVTTHPIIYAGMAPDNIEINYELYKSLPWYMPGVKPKSMVEKRKRITIGNDVWLGRNVIVTNGANIGNGVIAGAGAVITKDVPDYAIVAGVPARIIRYRYTQEQMEALIQIERWNWSDDEIRERYDDFYLPIEEFIKKYK